MSSQHLGSLTSFGSFLQTIVDLPNANKTQHGFIIRQLLNYVKAFLVCLANDQEDLSQARWFKSENELSRFLARHNNPAMELSGDMRGKIKAFMITALVEIYKERLPDWVRTNFVSTSTDVLIARFHHEACFQKFSGDVQEWEKFLSIYDELRLISHILSQPNKYAMETAATMLALGEYLCVSGGKPSQYVICIHYLYTMVTGKKVKGRKISKDRESSYRPKYQNLMGSLRCDKSEDTDAEDRATDTTSCYDTDDSRVSRRARKPRAAKRGRPASKARKAAGKSKKELLASALLPTAYDSQVLTNALSDKDEEEVSIIQEDENDSIDELGFDFDEDDDAMSSSSEASACSSPPFSPRGVSNELSPAHKPISSELEMMVNVAEGLLTKQLRGYMSAGKAKPVNFTAPSMVFND